MRIARSMVVVATEESNETRLFEPGQRITHAVQPGFNNGFQNNSEPEINCVSVTNIGGSAAFAVLGNGADWKAVQATNKDTRIEPGETKQFRIYGRMIPVLATLSASGEPAVLAVALGSSSKHFSDAVDSARAMALAKQRAGIRDA